MRDRSAAISARLEQTSALQQQKFEEAAQKAAEDKRNRYEDMRRKREDDAETRLMMKKMADQELQRLRANAPLHV